MNINSINDFYNSLDKHEQNFLDFLPKIKNKIDEKLSILEVIENFVHLKVCGKTKELCAFEIYIGVETEKYKAHFYIGKGAEVFNYEDFSEEQDLYDLREDIYRFLKSETIEKIYYKDTRIAKAEYKPSIYKIDSLQITFTYSTSNVWFWNKKKVEEFLYQPWLS